MKNRALTVGGIIFLFVSLMHLVRLLLKVQIIVGNFNVPLWASFVGFLVALVLGIWMFRSSKV